MRILKKIDVNFISLVDKGANRKKLVFKRADGNGFAFEKQLSIKKFDEDQKMVFCIVYAPDEVDTQGDSASADVIKDAAYNFMRCARTNNVDKQHDFIPDEGFVAESWIVKENESVFPAETAGSWAVGIKVENEETWKLIKNGEITGISLAGLAVTEEVEKQTVNGEFDAGGVLPKDSHALENILGALNERLASIENENRKIEGRISKIENTPPASRQVKRETAGVKNEIKIWT